MREKKEKKEKKEIFLEMNVQFVSTESTESSVS